MTAADRRDWGRIVATLKRLGPASDPRLEALIRQADALLARVRRAPRVVQALPFERREAAKTRKTKTKRERRAEVYAAVDARAGGRCELVSEMGRCLSGGQEHDHWRGGSERSIEERTETVWLLCSWHHKQRQANIPSAGFWNDMFARHCERHGYEFRPHIEHAPLRRGGSEG